MIFIIKLFTDPSGPGGGGRVILGEATPTSVHHSTKVICEKNFTVTPNPRGQVEWSINK